MSQHPGPQTTRREFTRTVAVLAAAPLLGSTATPLAAAEPEKPDPLTVMGDALAEIARARYGKHLTEDQLKSVRRSIRGQFRSAEALQRFKLKNSDEPAVIFRADP